VIAFAPALNDFHDVARQWPDEVRRRVDAAVAAAEAARHEVRTAAAARAYVQRVRDAFWRAAGGLPVEGAPARGGAYQQQGSLVHLGLRITKLTYESLPGVPESALLYRLEPPAGRGAGDAAKRPGVVFLCGHYGSAKHHPEFQRVCLDLALHGIVALAIDPWGQGERHQYAVPGSAAGDPPVVPAGTFEHSYCGLQCHLTGGGVIRYFAWDAVRAVDILAAQPDVDPARIGVTGNSGGGVQTVLLMLADDRLAAAMPCTYITNMAALYRTGQTLDAEMSHPGSLAHGIDHADLLAGFAPKPLLVGAAAYDYFPVEATERSFEEARRIYALLGAGERFRLAVDDGPHSFSDRLREAAVRFFTRELDGDERFARCELPTVPEPDLWCSPTGQLYRDRRGLRGVFELNRDFLAAHRRTPSADSLEAAERLERALGPMPALDATPIRPRYFAPKEADGCTAQQVFFWSQPEVAVAGTLLRPQRDLSAGAARARTWLVLLPHGTASDEEALAEAIGLARGGALAFVFDPRGRGAVKSLPLTNYAPYDSWLGQEGWTNYVEMQLGHTTLASRVYDVRRAVSFLEQFEGARGAVAVRGRGVAALWGYLAAALDERVRAAHLSGMLPSWEEVVETRLFDSDTITAAMVIPGVLQHLDLPDLRQCFAGRELRIESPLRVAALPERLPLRRNA
jgi:cephalosporin-C deacetylase-like acetyl esterase